MLDCTNTGVTPVIAAKVSRTRLRHSCVCVVKTRPFPSGVQRTSLFSATYLPTGNLSVAALLVAFVQITGSYTSPLKTSMASRAPSGDQRMPRRLFLSAKIGVLLTGLRVDEQHATERAAHVGRVAITAEVLAERLPTDG